METYKIDDFQLYEFSSKKPKEVIFFAHANGIPALTYSDLWEKVSKELNVRVICYDMRGMGNTLAPPVYDSKTWGWKILIQDHVKLFQKIKKTHPMDTRFILCGHSLGGWLSLFATKFIGVYPLILCDPPLLYKKAAIKWFLMHLFNKREHNPRSQKALHRKTSFDSFDDIYAGFKKSAFLSKWDDNSLKLYIENLFFKDPKTKKILLRHEPKWEAHIFSQYPPTAAQGFMTLPKKLRHQLKPIFLVGGMSDACNPKAKKWVKFFFPQRKWIELPNVEHMFPIVNQHLILRTLRDLL